jgi:hypothetical protein
MGIHFTWDDLARQDILLFVIQTPWTWQEYDDAADEAFALLAQQQQPVANIVDATQAGKLPPGNPLPHLRHVYRLMPNNMTASVVVGASPTVRLFINVLGGIYPRAKSLAYFAATIQEARAIIKEQLLVVK